MKYFDDFPAKNSIILFFPSLLRVDDKVNVKLIYIDWENPFIDTWINLLRFIDCKTISKG